MTGGLIWSELVNLSFLLSIGTRLWVIIHFCLWGQLSEKFFAMIIIIMMAPEKDSRIITWKTDMYTHKNSKNDNYPGTMSSTKECSASMCRMRRWKECEKEIRVRNPARLPPPWVTNSCKQRGKTSLRVWKKRRLERAVRGSRVEME